MNQLHLIAALTFVCSLLSPVHARNIRYLFINEKMTFNSAEEACQQRLGGHLASISNSQELSQAMLAVRIAKGMGSNKHIWIGLNETSEHKLQWVDNTIVNYTHFAQDGRSRNGTCVHIQLDTEMWYLDDCNINLALVCIFTEPEPVPVCESGWTWFNETNSCYKFEQKLGQCKKNLDLVSPLGRASRNEQSVWSECGVHRTLSASQLEDFCSTAHQTVSILGNPWHEKFLRPPESLKEMQSRLASIHSQAENDFIVELSKEGEAVDQSSKEVFIGLIRKADNSTFKWTDGTPFDFKPWAKGEPNNDNYPENCVQIYADEYEGSPHPPIPYQSRWNDRECNTPMRAAVCKKAATKLKK